MSFSSSEHGFKSRQGHHRILAMWNLLLFTVALAADQKVSLIEIQKSEIPHLLKSAGGSFDFTEVLSLESGIRFPADEEELGLLRREKVHFKVIQQDMTEHFLQSLQSVALGTAPEPPLGFGSMGGYYTYAEIGQKLDELHNLFPNVIGEKISIGLTLEGRDIWASRISNNPTVDQDKPRSFFDAMHHAREPQGMMSLIHFMYELGNSYGSDPFLTQLVDQREIWCIPCVNPDGYVHNQSTSPLGGGMWRKNRRPPELLGGCIGVDLNRNYSIGWGVEPGSSSEICSGIYRGLAPFSELEIQALTDFYLSQGPFGTSNSIHTFGNLHMYPWGYTQDPSPIDAACFLIGNWHAQDNLYTVGPIYSTIYPASGVATDWAYTALGSHAFTSEIGSQFWPTPDKIVPLALENLNSFARLVASAGAYVRLIAVSSIEGNGNQDFEIDPNETGLISLAVQNFGSMASGEISFQLTSLDPNVTVLQNQLTLPSLQAFAEENTDPTLLEIALACETASNSTVSLEIQISHDGFSSTQTIVIPVGNSNLNNPYDLDKNDVINLDDILCVLEAFTIPSACPGSDLAPCGGNGIINLDDILAELSAFTGIYSCPFESCK